MAILATPKLRAPQAAAYVGLSPSTLAKMRLRGDGPLYAKAGSRIVIYDKADLDAWLGARRRRSSSDSLGQPPGPPPRI
jgi:predicted DNA-binding transcriptional regulator AlpA